MKKYIIFGLFLMSFAGVIEARDPSNDPVDFESVDMDEVDAMDIASLLIHLEAQPMPAPIYQASSLITFVRHTSELVVNSINRDEYVRRMHENASEMRALINAGANLNESTHNGFVVAQPTSITEELFAIVDNTPAVEAVSHPVAPVTRVNSPVIVVPVRVSDNNGDVDVAVQARKIQ